MVRPIDGIPTLDLYADADFAGLWNKEDPQDPVSARSRTGYVVTLGGNPILWKSKLQTETATSTMMAEYIAVSDGMRSLIHLRHVYKEIVIALNLPFDNKSDVSMVFEDNQACLQLATQDPPKLTPKSRTIATKYHWFREQLAPGVIEFRKIATDLQLANILTKALSRDTFEKERKALLGW